MYANKKPIKKPKDTNAPKKNQSSYFIYSNERRPILQKETQQPVTEISKTISAEWKAMDPTQKKVYEDRAAEQKQKYLLELGEYMKTDNYTIYQKKFAEWKERATALGHIGKGSKKNKGKHKPPKKPKQPESMPKRPQSSYFLFSNERRVSIKEQYPDRKLTELSKLIAEEWKNISAEDKKGYEDKAKVCKDKYNIAIAEYKKCEEYHKYAERLDDWKAETKRFKSGKMDEDSDGEEIKVSLPRKPKDAKCPKRALTSYFLYAKEVREATKAEFPQKPITEIAKEISKKWKVLSEDEKKPYEEESKRLKEQYKKDIAEYEGSEAQNEYKKRLEEWKVECDRRRQAAKAKQKRKKEAQKKKSPKKRTRKSPKKKSSPKKVQKQRMDYSSSESDSDSSSGSSSGSDSGSSSSGSDSDSDSSSSSE